MLRAILVLLASLYVLHAIFLGEVRPADGVLAPSAPQQEDLEHGPRWKIGDFELQALARFELEARVLGTERYRFDREAALSPVDFALGWGPMSTNALLDTLDVSQYGRFFFYQTDEAPLIDFAEMGKHASNMHMIPADDAIRSHLLAVRTGQVVALRGFLVEAHGPDGFRWRSSLTRNDTGGGACELVLVESIAVR